MSYQPRPVIYNTNLSDKLETLKNECQAIGPDWEFDKTDPDTGIHCFAIGYGIAIADWRTVWREQGWKCIKNHYPLCVSKSKVDYTTKDYINKNIQSLSKYRESMIKTAELIAVMTRESVTAEEDRKKAQKELLKSDKEAIESLKLEPTPEFVIHSVKNFLQEHYLEYHRKMYRNATRRCGGGIVYINIFLPHFCNHRVFVFLRELNDKEKWMIERAKQRNPRVVAIVAPVTLWDVDSLKQVATSVQEEILKIASSQNPVQHKIPQETHS